MELSRIMTRWCASVRPWRSTGCGEMGPPFCWSRTMKNCCRAWPTKSGGFTRDVWRAGAIRVRRWPVIVATSRSACAPGSLAVNAPLSPRMRRGDGRAEIVEIATIGEAGQATSVWRSGELALVKVRVRFHAPVEAPVVGIMIRTRVGLNVYGTNTELERLALGPRAEGDTIEISFAFRAELCPGDYTLTAASHDPDGVWHDWLEDAMAFSVTDNRYTAGVANLHATVTCVPVQ